MSHHEELRWVLRPEGTHRSASRHTPGYERDLVREDESEKLRGPTESRPANIDEIIRSHTSTAPSRPTAAQDPRSPIGDALIDLLIDALRPHIDRGVNTAVDTAVLGGSKLWNWIKSRSAERRRGDNETQTSGAQLGAPAAETTADVNKETSALAAQTPIVSADEYQAVLLSVLLADQYAARGRQLLANVRVRDDLLPAELEVALHAALKGPTSSVDEATVARVVELLGGGSTVDGGFMLVENQESDARPMMIDRPSEWPPTRSQQRPG